MIYLELRHIGLKPKGLDLSFEKDGVIKNGQVDFVCQSDKGMTIYIQAVYSFTDFNFERETDSLVALPEGNKYVVFFEKRLFSRTLPSNVIALNIKEFCKDIERYCNKQLFFQDYENK